MGTRRKEKVLGNFKTCALIFSIVFSACSGM